MKTEEKTAALMVLFSGLCSLYIHCKINFMLGVRGGGSMCRRGGEEAKF